MAIEGRSREPASARPNRIGFVRLGDIQMRCCSVASHSRLPCERVMCFAQGAVGGKYSSMSRS